MVSVDMKTTVCVTVPVETKRKALDRHICFSEVFTEALEARIENLEREAGGNQNPLPGHPDVLTTEADPC